MFMFLEQVIEFGSQRLGCKSFAQGTIETGLKTTTISWRNAELSGVFVCLIVGFEKNRDVYMTYGMYISFLLCH